MAKRIQRYDKEYKHKYYLANKDKMKSFQKARYNANPEAWKLQVRKRNLRKNYFPDLSVEEAWNKYQTMIKNQNNLCGICNNPETKIDPQLGRTCSLAVDHCHTTKKVRALLCFRCNTGLGNYERKKNMFSEYLRKFD